MTEIAATDDGTTGAAVRAPAMLGCRPPLWRRCGRCLLDCPGEPALDRADERAWWLCPGCRNVILGTALPK